MGESLQSDGPGVRLYRLGLLADELAARGADVVRWAPTFVHSEKRQRYLEDTVVPIDDHHEIRLIYAPGYVRHRGLRRLRFHRRVAKRWEELADTAPRPDLIFACLPTPEACEMAVELGRRYGVPVIVDVRDLMPDAFFGSGRVRRAVLKVITAPMARTTSRALQAADGIVAISNDYFAWALERARRAPRPIDRVVPLSYAPPQLTPEMEKAADARWNATLEGRPTLAVFCGNLNAQFAVEDVIAAARLVEKTAPGAVEWVICGDGPMLDRLVTSADDLPNVRFPGWVGGPELSALLRRASIGLGPYAGHAAMSLPNKAYEYWSAGLPMVSSLGGELRELIAERGLGTNYRAGDAAGLAAAVLGYHHNAGLRGRHGENGLAYWKAEASPSQVYGDLAEHLLDLAGRRG